MRYFATLGGLLAGIALMSYQVGLARGQRFEAARHTACQPPPLVEERDPLPPPPRVDAGRLAAARPLPPPRFNGSSPVHRALCDADWDNGHLYHDPPFGWEPLPVPDREAIVHRLALLEAREARYRAIYAQYPDVLAARAWYMAAKAHSYGALQLLLIQDLYPLRDCRASRPEPELLLGDIYNDELVDQSLYETLRSHYWWGFGTASGEGCRLNCLTGTLHTLGL